MAKKRLQFDFSEDAHERLVYLRQNLDYGSIAEVVRHALKVFDFIVRSEKEGATFYVKTPDGESHSINVSFQHTARGRKTS